MCVGKKKKEKKTKTETGQAKRREHESVCVAVISLPHSLISLTMCGRRKNKTENTGGERRKRENEREEAWAWARAWARAWTGVSRAFVSLINHNPATSILTLRCLVLGGREGKGWHDGTSVCWWRGWCWWRCWWRGWCWWWREGWGETGGFVAVMWCGGWGLEVKVFLILLERLLN